MAIFWIKTNQKIKKDKMLLVTKELRLSPKFILDIKIASFAHVVVTQRSLIRMFFFSPFLLASSLGFIGQVPGGLQMMQGQMMPPQMQMMFQQAANPMLMMPPRFRWLNLPIGTPHTLATPINLPVITNPMNFLF